jgi:hypothetical protein
MGSLLIRRHHAHYRLMDSPNNDAIAADLDLANSTHLPLALSDSILDRGDDVWLIRSLNVDSVAMADWSSGAIADRLAGNIAASLVKIFDSGPDESNSMHFQSRPAYVARFLVEAAKGTAKNAWYFAEFKSMALMTAGQVLCEFSIRDPEVLRLAIQSLLPKEQDFILRNTQASEAKQFLTSLATTESRSPSAADVVLTVLEALARAGDISLHAGNLTLKLYLAAMSSQAKSNVIPLAQSALEIAECALTLLQSSQPQKTIVAWQRHDWPTLRNEIGATKTAQLAAFHPLTSDERARLAKAIQPESTVADSADSWTPFGAMFILLPLLEGFEWASATQGWPTLRDHQPKQILQFLTIVGALGAIRANRTFNDPILRECLDIDPKISSQDIRDWFEALPKSSVDSFLPAWVGGLARSFNIDVRDVASGSGPRGEMSTDRIRGVWLGRSVSRISDEEIANITADEYAIAIHEFVGSEALGELILLTSQALLRSFAWRLPGFSNSSIAFLQENFFAFSATVLREETRNVVFVSNPPLNIVLSLTGLNRKRFRLPHGGDFEWILASR